MNRRLLVLFALLVMLLTSMAAQANFPISFEPVLTSPAHNGIVTTSQVTFTWTGAAANKYVVTLKSVDGKQKIKLSMYGSQCVAAAGCELTFTPQAHGWTWREDTSYMWRVVWKQGSTKLAKTPFNTFVTDMLRSTANVSPTPNGHHVDIGYVVFYWKRKFDLNDYRVVVLRPDGSRFTSGWLSDWPCTPSECYYTAAFTDEAKGNYRWHVVARRDGVKGKVKSTPTMFTYE